MMNTKLLLGLIVLIACVAIFKKMNGGSQGMSNTVSMQEFKNNILNENTYVLDVRTPAEFDGELGHIDGATLLPLQELPIRMNELESKKEQEIYVVCRSGGRSAQATAMLRAQGYNAINVDGGMLAWNALSNE
jgi:rhodanese-related sulfurtransferase